MVSIKPAAIAAALTLASCATAGTNYSDAAVASLTPGMTRAQVIAAMGEPDSQARLADGRETLGWSHASAFGSAKAIFLQFDAQGRYTGAQSSARTK